MATLAALRSPFAPPHVLTGLVFVLFVMVGEIRTRWSAVAYVGAFLVFLMHVPIEAPVPSLAVSLAKQLALITFLAWVAVRRDPVTPSARP